MIVWSNISFIKLLSIVVDFLTYVKDTFFFKVILNFVLFVAATNILFWCLLLLNFLMENTQENLQ